MPYFRVPMERVHVIVVASGPSADSPTGPSQQLCDGVHATRAMGTTWLHWRGKRTVISELLTKARGPGSKLTTPPYFTKD